MSLPELLERMGRSRRAKPEPDPRDALDTKPFVTLGFGQFTLQLLDLGNQRRYFPFPRTGIARATCLLPGAVAPSP